MDTRQRIEASVVPDVAQWLADMAAEQGVTTGRIIEELVLSFMDESKKEG